MPDQADNLRHLIHTAPPAVHAAPEGLPLVVVTGGRAGVGATTVAVNLAAALADRNQRVLVVDAADEGSNIAEIAGVRSAGDHSLADVLDGKCKIAHAVMQGPAGTSLLTIRSRISARRECEFRRNSATWQKRLMSELQLLRDDFDVMVIDTGAGLSPLARRLWLRAQLVLLVTTCDDAALMDAYAAVKLHATGARDASCGSVQVLVNQSENDRAAAEAQQRLSNCCRRFLRQSIAALPPLPRFDDRDEASDGLSPRVWESPNSRFGHAALWLGRAVCDVLEEKGAGAGGWRLGTEELSARGERVF
jgi:flagellar biosynthesis protein FlhG